MSVVLIVEFDQKKRNLLSSSHICWPGEVGQLRFFLETSVFLELWISWKMRGKKTKQNKKTPVDYLRKLCVYVCWGLAPLQFVSCFCSRNGETLGLETRFPSCILSAPSPCFVYAALPIKAAGGVSPCGHLTATTPPASPLWTSVPFNKVFFTVSSLPLKYTSSVPRMSALLKNAEHTRHDVRVHRPLRKTQMYSCNN